MHTQQEYKKILIVNLGGIGDFLLSVPAVRALRRRYASAQLVLVAVPRVNALAARFGIFDTVQPLYTAAGISLPGIVSDAVLLMRLRRMRFDLAVNMRTIVSRSSARKIKFLFECIRARTSAGRDTDGLGAFFDIRVPETLVGAMHEMDYDIRTAEALGARVDDAGIRFPLEPEARERIQARLKDRGIGPQDVLIVVHPGGKPLRRWPVKSFARAIELVAVGSPVQCVTALSDNERGLAQELVKTSAVAVHNLTGLSFADFTALLERCSVFITNDTGPMHVAAALAVPLVAVCGSSDITRYDPRRLDPRAVVIRKPVDCAPCEDASCRSRRCFEAISAEEVAQAALELLRKGSNVA